MRIRKLLSSRMTGTVSAADENCVISRLWGPMVIFKGIGNTPGLFTVGVSVPS